MSKLQIPVTVPNVACELFNRVYRVAVRTKYLVGTSFCAEEDLLGLSLYLYLSDNACNPDIDADCLVDKLYENSVPCDRVPNEYTCGISLQQIHTVSCGMIKLTIV